MDLEEFKGSATPSEVMEGWYKDYENHGKLTKRQVHTKLDKYVDMSTLLNIMLDVEFFGLVNHKPEYETRQAIVRALLKEITGENWKVKILVETE